MSEVSRYLLPRPPRKDGRILGTLCLIRSGGRFGTGGNRTREHHSMKLWAGNQPSLLRRLTPTPSRPQDARSRTHATFAAAPGLALFRTLSGLPIQRAACQQGLYQAFNGCRLIPRRPGNRNFHGMACTTFRLAGKTIPGFHGLAFYLVAYRPHRVARVFEAVFLPL